MQKDDITFILLFMVFFALGAITVGSNKNLKEHITKECALVSPRKTFRSSHDQARLTDVSRPRSLHVQGAVLDTEIRWSLLSREHAHRSSSEQTESV
jgi:hypothetical protein